MSRKTLTAFLAWAALVSPAVAHYGMIIPSDPLISQEDGRGVTMAPSFSHPFGADGMVLERPAACVWVHLKPWAGQ